MGISEQTFYRWKKVYGGLGVGELKRLRQLEDDLSLDKHILQDVLLKMHGPPRLASLRCGGQHSLRKCIQPVCGHLGPWPSWDTRDGRPFKPLQPLTAALWARL